MAEWQTETQWARWRASRSLKKNTAKTIIGSSSQRDVREQQSICQWAKQLPMATTQIKCLKLWKQLWGNHNSESLLSRRNLLTLDRNIPYLQWYCKILALQSFLWRAFKAHKFYQRSLEDKMFLAMILWAAWFLPRSYKTYISLIRSLRRPYIESNFSKGLGPNLFLQRLWKFLQGY